MTGKPCKIIIASVMFGPYGTFPGLEARLGELAGIIDNAVAEAGSRFGGKAPDIIALPEVIVCGGLSGTASSCSVDLKGPVLEMFASKAREHGTYLTIPLYLVEDPSDEIFRNSIALVDRSGNLAGIYHKHHPVIGHDGKTLEGGITPGTEVPVFTCDFGTVGFQICYDIGFDDGWEALGRAGAEVVIWSTQSPQTVRPAAIALREGYYIVSSTWRNNLSLFEPTGIIANQVTEPGNLLVAEIDLEYMILPWSHKLRNGSYLDERYGGRIGYRYYESEDCGIFWSNDENLSIKQVVQETGLETVREVLEKNAKLQNEMRR